MKYSLNIFSKIICTTYFNSDDNNGQDRGSCGFEGGDDDVYYG